MYIDSHCHLNFPELNERLPQVLEQMAALRVSHALVVSVNLETVDQILKLADQHPQLMASVGVHPDYEDVEEPTVERLVELAQHPKVVAMGETGLDYFRLGERTEAEMEWQRERFRVHIRAAKQAGKPLIVHTRNAADDTLRILQEEGAAEVGGVLHCFTESYPVAAAALELNFMISFSGIVTFKNAQDLRETAVKLPLDRILVETDSPYLAPVPHRGKTNEPGWVAHVGAAIAQLRGISDAEMAAATTRNFLNLFKSAQSLV